MYFLNINKPKGISSFDCIRKLRKLLHIKAIGHSGTLDPLASGVLQIGVGDACKLLDYLNSDKTYIADLKFGYTTETLDSETEEKFVKNPDFSKVDLENVLKEFTGEISQIPPKYSAIKVEGKKLCNLMRKRVDNIPQIKPRKIMIYSIELLDFNGIDKAKIKVKCSKGTYIRSLVDDIGKKLLCGAYMTDLVRIQAGNFKIENSQSLETQKFREIDPQDVLDFDKYELNEIELDRISNGNFIKTPTKFNTSTILLTNHNKLVSIAYLSDNINGISVIKPKKTFKGNIG
ncbi:tRNA pseudouridine(55) synthase TruB [bacterium]|nr:tRNA pseudouridine(55) synthase TruB [bacterium]